MHLRPVTRFIIAATAALAVTIGIAVWVLSGNVFPDERACQEGQAPYNHAEGGSDCGKPGEELPPGATWDPRGNYTLD